MNDNFSSPYIRYALDLKDINQTRRPNLARIIKNNKFVWCLGDLPQRRHDMGEPILAAIQEDYTPDDMPKTPSRVDPHLTQTIRFIISEFSEGQGQDKITTFPVPYMCMDRLARILLDNEIRHTKQMQYEIMDLKLKLDAAQTNQKGGRPCKYQLEDIKAVMALRKQGMSIRKVAKKLNIAASTVQRLIAKGETLDLKDSTGDLPPVTGEE
jgi:hypothetical protein